MTKAWSEAIRLHTLPAGAAPVIMGIAIAHYQFFEIKLSIALITLLVCLLLQISSNLINDYYDGIKGTDNENRIGFQRATSSGTIPENHIKFSFILTLSLSFLLGCYLSLFGGKIIFGMGILSLLFAYLYTAGPYPLSYNALGEVAAFIFFGPVAVVGSNYLQTGVLNTFALFCSFIPGFISAAILAINNLRDRETDKEANKTTLANLMSEKNARILVILFIVLANVTIIYLGTLNSYFYLSLIPFFIFLQNWATILKEPIDSRLNLSLKKTGIYLTLTSLLFSLSCLIK